MTTTQVIALVAGIAAFARAFTPDVQAFFGWLSSRKQTPPPAAPKAS